LRSLTLPGECEIVAPEGTGGFETALSRRISFLHCLCAIRRRVQRHVFRRVRRRVFAPGRWWRFSSVCDGNTGRESDSNSGAHTQARDSRASRTQARGSCPSRTQGASSRKKYLRRSGQPLGLQLLRRQLHLQSARQFL